ncbi:MAG: kelch repeat-containing protein [Planctomycetota bacterium]
MRGHGGAFLIALLVACGGGGGGGGTPFRVTGSSPETGTTEADIDVPVLIVFNRPADVATLNQETVRLETADGVPVGARILVQGFNSAAVNVEPFANLDENVGYRVVLSGVRATDGTALATQTVCFVTRSSTPTVRPDQLLDLGDALQVPRFRGVSIRMRDGRTAVIGGYSDPQTATDTIEIYEPTTRGFRLLTARLTVPRAEFTVTQLNDRRIVIAGGVSEPGGAPLASTDIFDPGSETVAPGPSMNIARREHAASGFFGNDRLVVSGGFDADGEALDSLEELRGTTWEIMPLTLPEPTAQGIQVASLFDRIYFSASNLLGISGYINAAGEMVTRAEGDIRFRPAYATLSNGDFLIIGGDTRSMVTIDMSSGLPWGASSFLRERRGLHSVTVRGNNGRRLLVVGGFNRAVQGEPPLTSMEIVDALDPGPFGFPDAVAYRVDPLRLPVPFAGHVGFNDNSGRTIIAGGVGDGVGPHSRRAIMIVDNANSLTVDCD